MSQDANELESSDECLGLNSNMDQADVVTEAYLQASQEFSVEVPLGDQNLSGHTWEINFGKLVEINGQIIKVHGKARVQLAVDSTQADEWRNESEWRLFQDDLNESDNRTQKIE
jgi:hypothetical protein